MMSEADLDLARMRLAAPEHLHPDEAATIAADLADECERLREQRDRYNIEVICLEAGQAARFIRDYAAARVEAERYGATSALS